VDTQTRHALKKDSFAQATASSVNWLGEHRSGVVRWVVGVVVVAVLLIGTLIFWNWRTATADTALGAAMDTYSAPLAQPGAPAEKGVYATASDRSKAAHQQFLDVASKYGWTADGTKAHYFAGITANELGQTATAEAELKIAAEAWDRNVANLAKLALANIYHQTARDGQAIEVYTALAAKPSETVTASVAKLDLADLYVAQGKEDLARKLWAEVKDADKDGMAGSIAAQKLGGNK
jgi:predicted negative regulator of RcsB-dependent stress response